MTTTRTCPACQAQLELRSHEDIEVDVCPAGCGVWLDGGELRRAVESEASDRSVEEELAAVAAVATGGVHAVVADAARAPRACPVCSAAMFVREYPGSGVAIDECADHGTWLDAGELERIEAYAEGMRRQVAEGAGAAPAGGAVRGIPVPAHIIASLRSSIAG